MSSVQFLVRTKHKYFGCLSCANMGDAKQTPREFLTEFIELYRSFPCLWLVKCKDYSDRNKKDIAYTELVKKYQECDPSADRNTVVKKINALRTVYRKELAKVIQSEKSGTGADDIYKPTLWYFDLLHFLNDQDSVRPSRSTMSDADQETQQDVSTINFYLTKIKMYYNETVEILMTESSWLL